MKINIIHHTQTNNIVLDAETLSYLFKRFKSKPKIEHVNISNYTCPEATVNIFLETINFSFLRRAKYNILIPNQHYFHKNWIEFLPSIDLILCKTHYCYDVLKDYVEKDKIKHIGWRTANVPILNIDKDRNDFLAMYTDACYIDIQKLIDIWELDYPTLNIVFSGVPKKGIVKRNLANIVYLETINQNNFEKLFNSSLVHIILDQIDNFNHNANQCMLAGSVPIAINKGPILDVIDTDNYFKISSTKKKITNFLGSKYTYSKEELKSVIEKVIGTSEATLEIMGNNGRQYAERNQNIFTSKFMDLFNTIFKETIHRKFNKTEYSDSDLPSLSIITVYNSTPKMFKLPILNYKSTNYPKDKIEWIVVDAKEESIESLLPPENIRQQFNIKYIRAEKDMTIGAQKNLAIEQAKNDVIMMMDDDYFFYQDGINKIIKELLKSEKSCIGCSLISGFHITKYISIILVSNMLESYSNRLYQGTLCFYRSFWENGKFDDTNTGESKTLLQNRLTDFTEISWEEKFVALIYSKNEMYKQIPANQEPNGCHYKLSKKVFEFICSLDEEKKPDESTDQTTNEVKENEDTINNTNIKEI